MTAPVRPRTMTPERERDLRAVYVEGPFEDKRSHADTWTELDAERSAHDATLARLADVERGRAAYVRRLGVATGRRFIPDERIADIDVVEHAMVTVRVQAEAAKEALAAAEQRLARLRPLVRWAFGVWDWLWGSKGMDGEDGWDLAERAEKCGLAARVKYDPEVHGETEADPGDEILYPGDLDPTDRAWATEEER